jgi:diguanylate cyclase (GGDEF)-like protein/PAS domain S-box-containing protein
MSADRIESHYLSSARTGAPDKALKVLLVEDLPSDVELIQIVLRELDMPLDLRQVETEPAYIAALGEFDPDIILSDFSLPLFDGSRALALAKERRPDTPFIYVSGAMGEENAIRALKDGAIDYVLKHNLVRLPAAVERALKESRANSARKSLEAATLELFQANPHAMWIYDRSTLRFLKVNQAAITRYGYSSEEFLALTVKDIRPISEIPRILERIENRSLPKKGEIWRHMTKEGRLLLVEISSKDFVYLGRDARLIVAYDVTERQTTEDKLRDSEARFRELIEQAADGICITDGEGNFVLVNSRGAELLGYRRDELLGMNSRHTYVEGEVSLHAERFKQVINGTAIRFERQIRRKDGSTFPSEISMKMLSSGMVQVIFHDISTRKEHEQRIVRLQRIHAVLSGISSAIIRIRDRQTLFQEACRIASEHGTFHIAWIGLIKGERLVPVAWAGEGSDLFERIPAVNGEVALSPGGLASQAYRLNKTFFSNDITDNPSLDFVRQEVVNRGCQSAIALPLQEAGQPSAVFMVYCDQKGFFDDEEVRLLEDLAGDVSFAINFIAEREKTEYLSFFDALTGLPNRAAFFERLTQQLSSAQREHGNVALILIDLDRFRHVNDTLGRSGGDALLQTLTSRLKTLVRNGDVVARVGADTFALSLAGNWQMEDIAYALEVRNRLLFGDPYRIGNEEIRVSASTGIAISPGDGDSAEALFVNAEAALRKAKKENAKLMFYSPELNIRVADTLRLETQLRSAIEKNELRLWYQPKIELASGKLIGFEALMRWHSTEHGIVPPIKFIPLMEQTGLILDAGNWALSQVSVDCERWTGAGFAVPRIAVNVSPLQLRQRNFLSVVIEAASNAENAGSALDLEITESVVMENVDSIVPILQTIRGLGVEVAIDDFGTGYSSLAYIARLPIHSLKIDRSFVVGMEASNESLAIVRSVISLAHSLRLKVIAEGVEEEAQAELLRVLSCDQIQGYLVSPPVPAEAVPALIKKLSKI